MDSTQIFFNGPDQIVPAENLTTSQPDGYVRLRIPESGKAIEILPPISIPSALKRTVEKMPHAIALASKENGKWKTITYTEYQHLIRTCAKAFIHLGLERRHSVCIIGFNSVEWFLSDLGAIFAGGIAVGVYTTNSADACFYCAESSRANIIVVEDDEQLEKILSIRDKLPKLKAIVQYKGEPKYSDIISWEKLIQIGESLPDDLVEERLKNMAVNECCTLIYTSGTVGRPKAVMLNHDNFTYEALNLVERVGGVRDEVLISYLPLSHVAAQLIDIYLPMLTGSTVYFADKMALKGTLINTLQEAQPTRFIAVPRVWEKIYEKMQQVAAENGFIKRAISSWAKEQTLQYHLNKTNGIATKPWGYAIASSVIFKKVKQALGLSQCKMFFSAAAPLSPDIKKYFLSIDIPIMEAFGMSESSGAHTLGLEHDTNIHTIGRAMPGMKSKLYNPENGQGEICMYGRHICMGYMNDEVQTAEAIDNEGWLHSGDLGRIDEDGFLYITGRIKEIIITAGGENVAPIPIEQMVKSELPHISNVFLVGDKRKFLSILITFNTDIDQDGVPLDTLTPPVQAWLKSLGCPASTVTEVLQNGPHEKLCEAIQHSIKNANLQATSNAQKIQKFTILPVDFSIQSGELGPTMKVKRRVVENKYSELIQKMYN